MKKPVLVRVFSPLAALMLLAACILVNDFGKAWEEAKPDFCLTKIAQSLYYAEFNREPVETDMDNLARGWSYEKNTYLMLKKQVGDKGGRLYRFRVKNGIFERFRLVPTMREAFEHDYANAPVSLKRDTVTLDALNEKTLPLLKEISGKDKYWESADKILYNPLRNPSCRFEDRDLSKLDEPSPKPSGKPHVKK